jgi:hypothetical protein
MIFDWGITTGNTPGKINGFGALIVALTFIFSLRFILVVANFIRSYRVFEFISVFATLILLVRSLPSLFAAASRFWRSAANDLESNQPVAVSRRCEQERCAEGNVLIFDAHPTKARCGRESARFSCEA